MGSRWGKCRIVDWLVSEEAIGSFERRLASPSPVRVEVLLPFYDELNCQLSGSKHDVESHPGISSAQPLVVGAGEMCVFDALNDPTAGNPGTTREKPHLTYNVGCVHSSQDFILVACFVKYIKDPRVDEVKIG